MMRNQSGFTLIEAAIAGVVLLVGTIMTAQLVRITLDTTTPVANGPIAPQDVGIVDQYLRAQVAALKATPNAVITPLATMSLGSDVASITIATSPFPSMNDTRGVAHQLISYDVTVYRLPANKVVGFTRFWKLNVGGARAGI
ncbi:prepilin-type N-terminal cleavage/methylation domain-containing protein [bacterium]|nr:prepilin-type N-terminal cleavage/methylation domain-containing protein [bacterium]